MQGSWQNYALLNTTPVQVDANGSIFSGTGFFVLWQTQEGTALFLVSNKHVLRSKQSAVSVLLHQRTDIETKWFAGDGARRVYIDPFNHKRVSLKMEGRYFEHPTADIACIECSEFILRDDTFLMPFSQKRILDWSTSELYPGQQVFVVGYPDMIRDELHNLPIVRTATLASLPALDYNGKPEFVIDGQVWAGSSGSPVFVQNTGADGAFSLIGIVHSQIHRKGNREIHLGLGIAAKSSALVELLNDGWEALKNSGGQLTTSV